MSMIEQQDLPCPWCAKPLTLVRETSWGYYDHSHIECRNEACAVKPRGKKMDNSTWTQGEGTEEHPERTAEKLIAAWRAIR